MGLHPDVKKHLRARFPKCVNDDIPPVEADVIIWDAMWSLFKFDCSKETACGEDLVDFLYRPIDKHFLAGENDGGKKAQKAQKAYVVCFDIPECVPNAKVI